jgi:hypothetical protein
MTDNLETRLGLVITDKVYFQTEPDISNAILLLFPYEREEAWFGGYASLDFEEKPCTELHIHLNADFPTEMQQEYLRHLLKRGLLLDVTVNSESIREKLMEDGARIANVVQNEGAFWREMPNKVKGY